MAITTRQQLSTARTDSPFFMAQSNASGMEFLFFPPMISGNTQPWGKPWANPAAFGAGGSLLTKTAQWAWNFADPGAGEQCHFSKVNAGLRDALVTNGLRALWYDLVWGCSGFDGTVTTAQNVVGFPALNRPDANGTGLDIILVNLSSGGGTLVNATIGYTNENGTAGRTAVTEVTKRFDYLGLAHIVRKQSGDRGVQSVQSLTFSATTGIAGNIGMFLGKLIAVVELPINRYGAIDYGYSKAGLTQIHQDAALLPLISSDTANKVLMGTIGITYG